MIDVNVLASAAQNGDKAAQEALWCAVRRYGLSIALKYRTAAEANGGVCVEDLQQLSALGMLEALQTWKPDRKLSFLGWMHFYVHRACAAALGFRGRQRVEHYQRISLAMPISTDDEDLTLEDVIADTSLPGMTDALELSELQRDVRAAVEALPADEAETVRRHDLQGEPLAALPDGQQLHTRALYHLRKAPRLRIYAPYYTRHKGVTAFQSSFTSEVEDAALKHLQDWTP